MFADSIHEIEPNNSGDTAQMIQYGASRLSDVLGVISTRDDNDYYSVSFLENFRLKVSITNQSSTHKIYAGTWSSNLIEPGGVYEEVIDGFAAVNNPKTVIAHIYPIWPNSSFSKIEYEIKFKVLLQKDIGNNEYQNNDRATAPFIEFVDNSYVTNDYISNAFDRDNYNIRLTKNYTLKVIVKNNSDIYTLGAGLNELSFIKPGLSYKKLITGFASDSSPKELNLNIGETSCPSHKDCIINYDVKIGLSSDGQPSGATKSTPIIPAINSAGAPTTEKAGTEIINTASGSVANTDSHPAVTSVSSQDPSLITFEQDADKSQFKRAILDLKSRGVISGYSDGSFKPFATINRAEFMKIIVGAAGKQPSGNSCFKDVKKEWFAGYVCQGKLSGVTNGYPDQTFKPSATINVAEALKMTLKIFNISVPAAQNHEDWHQPFVQYAQQHNFYLTNFTSPNMQMTREAMAELVYRMLNQ